MTSPSVPLVSCLFNMCIQVLLPSQSLLPPPPVTYPGENGNVGISIKSCLQFLSPFISFIKRNHSFRAYQSSTGLIVCEVILVKIINVGEPENAAFWGFQPASSCSGNCSGGMRKSLTVQHECSSLLRALPSLGIHPACPNAHPSSWLCRPTHGCRQDIHLGQLFSHKSEHSDNLANLSQGANIG